MLSNPTPSAQDSAFPQACAKCREKTMKLFLITLKTRSQIQDEIPRELQGWWADVCPGATLRVREATQSDIERCILNKEASRDPADYYCENIERGALVSKLAVARVEDYVDTH